MRFDSSICSLETMEACNNDMPEQTFSNIQYVDLVSNQKEHKKKKKSMSNFSIDLL